MKKIHSKKTKHINTRMLFSYLSVIVLFAILLAVVISVIFTTQWKKEMNHVIEQKIDLVENDVNKKVGEVRNLHVSLLNNEKIQTFMKQAETGEITLSDRVDIFEWMQKYKENNANIISCLVTDNRGEILDSRSNNIIYTGLTRENKSFDEMMKSKRISYFSVPSTFPVRLTKPTYQDKNTVTYYGRYYNSEDYIANGYLVINLKKSGLFHTMDKICENTFENAFIVNEKDDIIYQHKDVSNDVLEQIKNTTINEDECEEIFLQGEKYFLYYRTMDDYPDWKFYGVLSYREMIEPMKQIYIILSVITGSMLLIVAWISFRIAGGITKPILQILEAMKMLGHGNFPEPIKVRSQDEMRELARGFNAMVFDIHNLQDAIILEQEKQKEVEVSMMKSKLDLLQSQINPHFIHNTLNTMRYMAQIEGNEKLVHTIVAFNTLLRTSMNTGKEFITVSEEIDNMNHYLDIQKQRYDAQVHVECYVFDDVNFAVLPKLILQPLVENSLFHGIIPKGEGTIKIIFRKQEHFLSISVSDDGIGIPEEKQEHILEEKKNSQRGYNNIGLANVNERLVLYYGEDSKLRILSSEEFGTFICFNIPFEE